MHAVSQPPEGERTKTSTGELDISPLAGRELRGARTHLPEVGADPGWSRVRFYINLMDPETFSAGCPSQWGQSRRPSLDLPFEVFVDTPKPLPATPPTPAPGEEQSMGRHSTEHKGCRASLFFTCPVGPSASPRWSPKEFGHPGTAGELHRLLSTIQATFGSRS